MIDVESRVEDLLNPCKFGESLRQQAFINAGQTSYVPNSQMIITLNNNETLDLSNSYIEFDLSLTNHVAQVPLILVIQKPAAFAAIDAGNYEIFYASKRITLANWNTAGSTVASNINNGGLLRPYFITVSGSGTDVNTGITLTFSSTYSTDNLIPSQFFLQTSTYITAGTISVPLVVTPTQNFVNATPRVEKGCPLISKLSVSINSESVVDISNANRLMNLINMMDGLNDKFGKEYEFPYRELGQDISPGTSMRVKIDLSFVDLFRSILPLELLPNPQIQILLNLEDPRLCLICSTANNSASQSYFIQNPRLQYHKIALTNDDKAMINSRLNSNTGLIIPFKSWTQFTGTVINGTSSASITFNPIRKHFLGIAILMLSQTYASDATKIRKLSTFLRNKVNDYRLKAGNLYFPLDKVNGSNVNHALVENVRTLVEFCEVVKNKRIIDDMELMNNFDGNYIGAVPTANDPEYTRYFPLYDEDVHTSSALAILCSDIGYSNLTSLCNRLTLEGVNTGTLPNVTLELNGMSPTSTCSVDIFSYAQEYLQFFKANRMNWIK